MRGGGVVARGEVSFPVPWKKEQHTRKRERERVRDFVKSSISNQYLAIFISTPFIGTFFVF